jgi:hypothetical protein
MFDAFILILEDRPMANKAINPLIVLSVLVFLSLVVAIILFGVLKSTGFVKSDYAEFGGAAAGFIATLYLLNKWYGKMNEQEYNSMKNELDTLKKTLKKINVPEFDLPKDYVPYIDHEHSMLFCYPEKWRRQPLFMQIQSIFSEEPSSLRPGDIFPGQFLVVMSSPGQQSYSLREVELMAPQFGISVKQISDGLGVEISDKNRALKVPIEQLLSVMGIEGNTKAEQIYQLIYEKLKLLSEDKPRKEDVLVNGIKSLLVEIQMDTRFAEPIVKIVVVTYVEDSDMIYTFEFTDNLSDRDNIDLLSKQILSTVKFWKESV